jgi:hypothetical protein
LIVYLFVSISKRKYTWGLETHLGLKSPFFLPVDQKKERNLGLEMHMHPEPLSLSLVARELKVVVREEIKGIKAGGCAGIEDSEETKGTVAAEGDSEG